MYINPKWVIVEFMRNRLTDPREERRPLEKVQSFVAVGGETEFIINISVGMGLSHISELKLNGTKLIKWQDYSIDFRHRKIIFNSVLVEDDEIELIFYEGSNNWIYWDRINDKLSELNFPRIAVSIVSGSGNRLGNYKAPIVSNINFQFDIYVKERSKTQMFEIEGVKYAGEDLCEYIGYTVGKMFEAYSDELHPLYWDYVPSQFPPRQILFDETIQAHRKIVECFLSGISVGQID